jgi:hypothetical protein
VTDDERSEIRREFREAVNMAPAEIERWLGREESKDVRHSRWRYSLMNWGHDPLR